MIFSTIAKWAVNIFLWVSVIVCLALALAYTGVVILLAAIPFGVYLAVRIYSVRKRMRSKHTKH